MLFTVTQYLESVLNSRGLTRTLGEIDVCRTTDGRPVFHTGNSAVVFRIRLDAFARRGDAVGYRTAQLLRSPVAKLPQAASLFAWRLRPPRPADDPPELAVDAGRWGFRSGGRIVGGPRRPQLPALRCRETFPQRYGRTAQRPAAGENRTPVEKLTLKRYICRLEI